MKFEDDAQVQIGDTNVDRSQGAARAISVRLPFGYRMALIYPCSHSSTLHCPGKIYRGSRASRKASALPIISKVLTRK
jgi:hypothetical protein